MKMLEVFNLICHIVTASLEIQTLEVWENYSGLTSNLQHDIAVLWHVLSEHTLILSGQFSWKPYVFVAY